LASSPVITATEQADLDLMPAFSLNEKKGGAFWMSPSSAPSSPIKEDYFSFDPNSPTGSMLDSVTPDVPAWAKSQCAFDGERRSTGRKIIMALCFLRLCVTFPLIWLEANLDHFAVSPSFDAPCRLSLIQFRSQMPRLFLASDDLLLVDCAASTIVRFASRFVVTRS
jgi:hypothetical protein